MWWNTSQSWFGWWLSDSVDLTTISRDDGLNMSQWSYLSGGFKPPSSISMVMEPPRTSLSGGSSNRPNKNPRFVRLNRETNVSGIPTNTTSFGSTDSKKSKVAKFCEVLLGICVWIVLNDVALPLRYFCRGLLNHQSDRSCQSGFEAARMLAYCMNGKWNDSWTPSNISLFFAVNKDEKDRCKRKIDCFAEYRLLSSSVHFHHWNAGFRLHRPGRIGGHPGTQAETWKMWKMSLWELGAEKVCRQDFGSLVCGFKDVFSPSVNERKPPDQNGAGRVSHIPTAIMGAACRCRYYDTRAVAIQVPDWVCRHTRLGWSTFKLTSGLQGHVITQQFCSKNAERCGTAFCPGVHIFGPFSGCSSFGFLKLG